MRKLILSKGMLTILTVLFFFAIFGIKANAQQVYGNQGIKPANSGATITVPSANYPTVQSAIDAANEGTTIIVKDNACGYSEQLKIKKNGITLKGEGNAKICGTEGMKHGDLLEIRGSDIVVENLEFTGMYLRSPSSSETAGGIKIKPGSNNVYVQNCKIWKLGCLYNYTNFSDRKKFNAHGISIKGSESAKTSNVTVSGCEVCNLTTGHSEAVVVNNNTEYFTLANNYIHDNDNIGIDCAGGYGDKDATDNARNGEVCANVVENSSSYIFKNPTYFDSKGNPDSGADGIYVDGGKDIYIHDNYVTGCDIGLEIASENHGWTAEGIVATRNLLINNDQYVGLAIGGSDESNGVAQNNIVTNNVILNRGENHCLVVKVAAGNVIRDNLLLSDVSPINHSSYHTMNDIANNSSNRAAELPGTNSQINLKNVGVDNINKKVVVETDTGISTYGYGQMN